MMKRQKTGRVVCAALTLYAALIFTACAGGTGQEAAMQAGQGGRPATDNQAGWDEGLLKERAKQDHITKQDQRTQPQEGKVAKLSLDGRKGRVSLTEGGDIWLSGTLEGQLVIDAQEDETVHLYLAGVEVVSKNGPAILVKEAAKVFVTLVSGMENVLSDSPDYTDCEGTPACLYSVCDLTINGDGALRVFGYHEDCIRSKDRIKLLDGTFSVYAKGDGIRGNDGIYLRNASVTVESEKNGLRTVNQGARDRGVIEMDGGTLSVIAGKNGICAASDLYLYHGQCSVNAVEERIRTDGTAYIAKECGECD